MERIDAINPQRIAWCCADLGITPQALANAASVPFSDLAPVLAQQAGAGLTFEQLVNISAVLGQDVLFFVDPAPVDAEQAYSEVSRRLTREHPRLGTALRHLIEQSEQQRSVFVALNEELDGVEPMHVEPPSLTTTGIAHMARSVRHWLGLGAVNAFDSYRTAIERQGVLVFLADDTAGAWQAADRNPVLGVTLPHARFPLIILKRTAEKCEQSLILMHLLAHLLLHDHSTIVDEAELQASDGTESDAARLARHVLVPDEFLAEIDDPRKRDGVAGYDDWLTPQQQKWGVGADLVLRRLVDANRLSQASYMEYRAWDRQRVHVSASRRFPHQHLHDLRQKYGEIFVRTVLDALDRGLITIPKASRYLDGLNLDELHTLERSYAGH